VDSRCLVIRLSPDAVRGDERFTTLESLRRALRLCFVGGRCLPRASPSYPLGPRASRPYLWHLCRLSVSHRWRFRTHRWSSESPRSYLPCVREDHTMSTTRDAFRRQVIAPSSLAPSFTDLATLPPRFGSRHRFAHRLFSPSFPEDASTDLLDPRPR